LQPCSDCGGGGGGAGTHLDLVPNSGPAGITVNVGGVGFSYSDAPVTTFTFDGNTPATQTCTSQYTGTNLQGGDFDCTFVVPNDGPGTYTVSATVTGASAVTGTASFYITTGTTTTITTTATSSSATTGTTSIGLGCSPLSIDWDMGTTSCTATVTGDSTSNTPSGTVTFSGLPSDATQTSCTLEASTPANIGICSVTYTAQSGDEGTYSVTASFPGDGYNLASGPSGAQSITVTTGTTTTLSCIPSSIDSSSGESVCTATVTAADPKDSVTPSGTVAFYIGDVPFPFYYCVLTGSGNAPSCGLPLVAGSGDEGTYSFTASYSGDTYNSASGPSSPGTLTVTTDTTTVFSCTPPDVIPYTGSLTGCTVTVTNVDSGYSVPPEGTISFSGGPSDFPTTCALSGSEGSSSCTFTYDAAIGDVGTYSITASFASGDLIHLSSGPSSPAQDLTITGTTSVGTTLSGANAGGSAPLGSSVGDSATVMFTPTGFTATGSVVFNFFDNGGCTGSPAYSVTGAVGTGAPAQGPLAPGSYGWDAQYTAGTGDSYQSSQVSTCESFTVLPASLTISTAVSPSTTPALGASVSDIATATAGEVAGFTPSGTVTITLYSEPGCTGSVISTQDGVALGTPSTAQTTLVAGSYSYKASAYTGDSNYVGSGYECEDFLVQKATATILTSINPSTTPALGSDITDTATATGMSGFTSPTGTVTISLYSGSTCGGAAIQTYPAVSLGNPSPTVSPNLGAGSYSFEASAYSGDDNYQAVSGVASSCEPFTVQQAQSSTSTQVEPSSSVLVGTSTHDTASLGSPIAGFMPTGTVTYSFYNSASCGGTPTSQAVTLSGGAVPHSSSLKLPPGQYSYSASYSGDSNYVGSAGGCEYLAVQTPTTTVLVCLPLTGTVGVPESCTAAVLNNDVLYLMKATGTVTFSGALPPGMPTSCAFTGGSGIISICTVSWTPAPGTEGNYHISVSYAGDLTHASSSTGGVLTIAKRGVSVSLSCSSPYQHNTPTTCTVTVTDTSFGTPITPTGTITFSSSGPGVFSSAGCTLSGSGATASCHVTFTPTSKGSYTVAASYGGDTNHAVGARSTSFKVT